MSTPDRVDVLIAGAGPVGLAAAVELGRRGVSCLLVERNDRVGYSPRAKTTNVRTREHLRRWGLADALRQASPIPPDYPPTVVFATRMGGHCLARFENAFNGARVRSDLYSEEAQWVPQYTLEEVLRRHAATLAGVTVAFDTRLAAFTQSADAVTATLESRASGVRQVESAYLIGADGARSMVREAIGARMLGDAAALSNLSVIFRSRDIAALHGLGPAIMYWMVNEELPAVLGPMDTDGLWYFMATQLPGRAERDPDPADMIRRSTGLAGLDVEIVGTDPWVARRLIADRYSEGRVFLAGDACHLHPPFGGFGMNMGIGDAVDLGWKLAARLQGWGGAALLDSYEAERRPVHERTMAEAVANYSVLGNHLARPGLEAAGAQGDATRQEVGEIIGATKPREFKTLGIVLGSSYSGSPIVVADGSPPPVAHPSIYIPSAHPGCLAPHLWLADGSSLYDRFGPGFTLLVTAGDADGAEGVRAAALARGVPLSVVVPDDGRLGPRYGARYALIRPDQHVAWRGDALPGDADAWLAHVTGGGAAAGSRRRVEDLALA